MLLENEFPECTAQCLRKKGHNVEWPITGFKRSVFGRGHVITRGAWWLNGSSEENVYSGSDVFWAAADSRCDGYPMGY